MCDTKPKSGSVRGFALGVFVTTWIGMFAYIVAPLVPADDIGYEPEQRAQLDDALRLSLDDLNKDRTQ